MANRTQQTLTHDTDHIVGGTKRRHTSGGGWIRRGGITLVDKAYEGHGVVDP